MNRDLNRVSVWCNVWGIKLNASKTKTMILSRSCTVHPQLTPLPQDGTTLYIAQFILSLTADGTVLKESTDLVILGGNV